MKHQFHNLTGGSESKIATAALMLLIAGASYGTPRISTITFEPVTQTVCIPASGTVSVSYVLHAVRGQNGTVNGVYSITQLPDGVTSDFIPGFTATGNNSFPDRTLTLNISSSAQPGDHSFSVTLFNSQGVTDQATVTGTLILNLAPSFTSIPSSILTNTDVGTCNATVNYSVTAIGYPAPAISYAFSGATDGTGSGTGSGALFNSGTTTVTITASNICSPAATASFSVTVRDNEAPSITFCPASATISCDASSNVAAMGYPSATDNCSGVSISFSDESTQNADVNNAAHYNYTITRTFTATDEENNSASCIQVITVQDIMAPSVSCIANAARNTNVASCEYTVSGDEFDATASADNCSGVAMNYMLSGATNASGSGSLNGMILNKGTTTIQWTASDVSGNSSSCSFDVMVNDAELPVLSVPADITSGTDEGMCGAMVTYNVTFSDNCPGAILGQESGMPSGSLFPVGTTTNVFTVVDASGNSSSASFSVTVYDNDAPTVVSFTKSDYNGYDVSCNGSCNGSATVNAIDNCSAALTYVWSNSQTGATATDLCAGTYTVTVSDGTNSASAEVTIAEPSILTVDAGPDAVTYYGYGLNQTLNRTAEVTGGVEPYNYTWSMNRPLMCNMVTNSGDESFGSNVSSPVLIICPESPLNFTMATPPVTTGQTVNVTLLDDAVIYVTVTDANGCTAIDSFTIDAEDVRCFAGNSGEAKVQMCHRTGSPKNPWIQICVSADAVPEHLAHGDYLGTCGARIGSSSSESTSELSIYPNPNNGSFILDFHSAMDKDEDITVTIKTVTGMVVYSRIINAADGHFKGQVDTKYLEQGLYIVSVLQGEESLNQTIAILK